MGISGLLPALRPVTREVHVSDLRGLTVAVDTYCWLHKAMHSCASELCQGIPTDRYIVYCIAKVNMLLHFGVTPYLVFDGGPLPAKAGKEQEREQRRDESRRRGLQLVREGQRGSAHQHFAKAVDVTPFMASRLIDACRAIPGVKWVVAPYEADAQLGYLCRAGHVDAVITEDSDLLLFGCHRVIFKLDSTGAGEEVRLEDAFARQNPSFDLRGLSHDQLVLLCALSGCDYAPSLPGIGLKKAHRLVTRYRELGRVLRALRHTSIAAGAGGCSSSSKKAASSSSGSSGGGSGGSSGGGKAAATALSGEEYHAELFRALLTFRHQRVFDPVTRQVVHMTPPPPEDLAEGGGGGGSSSDGLGGDAKDASGSNDGGGSGSGRAEESGGTDSGNDGGSSGDGGGSSGSGGGTSARGSGSGSGGGSSGGRGSSNTSCPLSDFLRGLQGELDFLGPAVDADHAAGVADGLIDPVSRRLFADMADTPAAAAAGAASSRSSQHSKAAAEGSARKGPWHAPVRRKSAPPAPTTISRTPITGWFKKVTPAAPRRAPGSAGAAAAAGAVGGRAEPQEPCSPAAAAGIAGHPTPLHRAATAPAAAYEHDMSPGAFYQLGMSPGGEKAAVEAPAATGEDSVRPALVAAAAAAASAASVVDAAGGSVGGKTSETSTAEAALGVNGAFSGKENDIAAGNAGASRHFPPRRRAVSLGEAAGAGDGSGDRFDGGGGGSNDGSSGRCASSSQKLSGSQPLAAARGLASLGAEAWVGLEEAEGRRHHDPLERQQQQQQQLQLQGGTGASPDAKRRRTMGCRAPQGGSFLRRLAATPLSPGEEDRQDASEPRRQEAAGAVAVGCDLFSRFSWQRPAMEETPEAKGPQQRSGFSSDAEKAGFQRQWPPEGNGLPKVQAAALGGQVVGRKSGSGKKGGRREATGATIGAGGATAAAAIADTVSRRRPADAESGSSDVGADAASVPWGRFVYSSQ